MSKNRTQILLSVGIAAVLLGTLAHGQDKTGEIDKIFAWATPNAPGCVAAVSQHGKQIVNRASE